MTMRCEGRGLAEHELRACFATVTLVTVLNQLKTIISHNAIHLIEPSEDNKKGSEWS